MRRSVELSCTVLYSPAQSSARSKPKTSGDQGTFTCLGVRVFRGPSLTQLARKGRESGLLRLKSLSLARCMTLQKPASCLSRTWTARILLNTAPPRRDLYLPGCETSRTSERHAPRRSLVLTRREKVKSRKRLLDPKGGSRTDAQPEGI
jgi:hypothetical protein